MGAPRGIRFQPCPSCKRKGYHITQKEPYFGVGAWACRYCGFISEEDKDKALSPEKSKVRNLDVIENIDDLAEALALAAKFGRKCLEEKDKRSRSGQELAQMFCGKWMVIHERAFRGAFLAGYEDTKDHSKEM